MIIFLLACAEPSTLGSVSGALAGRALGQAEEALRMMTATAGVVAEGCGAPAFTAAERSDGAVHSLAFGGPLATAIGATLASVVVSDTEEVWTFTDVGVDGALGDLEIATSPTRGNFAITYVLAGARFTAGLELNDCVDDRSSAVVAGNGTWTTAENSVAMTLVGVAPSSGLAFAPVLSAAPSAGQLRAQSQADGWVILLDDASTLLPEAAVWGGEASGSGWAAAVEIPWP